MPIQRRQSTADTTSAGPCVSADPWTAYAVTVSARRKARGGVRAGDGVERASRIGRRRGGRGCEKKWTGRKAESWRGEGMVERRSGDQGRRDVQSRGQTWRPYLASGGGPRRTLPCRTSSESGATDAEGAGPLGRTLKVCPAAASRKRARPGAFPPTLQQQQTTTGPTRLPPLPLPPFRLPPQDPACVRPAPPPAPCPPPFQTTSARARDKARRRARGARGASGRLAKSPARARLLTLLRATRRRHGFFQPWLTPVSPSPASCPARHGHLCDPASDPAVARDPGPLPLSLLPLSTAKP